jgi:hypothetical protein
MKITKSSLSIFIHLSFILASLFLFSSSLIAQNSFCAVAGQSVSVRGFRLGMTETEVKKRYPKIDITKDLDVVGLSHSSISKPSSDFEEVFTEEEREGLSSVELSFFNKTLSEFRITYDGFTEWDSLEEFTNSSAKALKLPLSVNWQKFNPISLKLVCKDFYIISTLEPKLGRYELQKQKLYFSLNDFKDKLETQKKNQKEEQKKVFKP